MGLKMILKALKSTTKEQSIFRYQGRGLKYKYEALREANIRRISQTGTTSFDRCFDPVPR